MQHRITGVFAIGVCFLLSFSTGAAAAKPMSTKPTADEGGIWKAYAPHGVRGELNNYDPIGLISGALIHADCSINFRDPDNGKLYCFSSGASLLSFQQWPKTNGRKADESFERMKKEVPQ